jgi:hypothetical protein
MIHILPQYATHKTASIITIVKGLQMCCCQEEVVVHMFRELNALSTGELVEYFTKSLPSKRLKMEQCMKSFRISRGNEWTCGDRQGGPY